MKRIVLLITFVAALALCAGAQTFIDFSGMPMAKVPEQMQDLYPPGINLYWDNFSYVTPKAWDLEGPGFVVGPNAKDVVFTGGPLCNLAIPCSASIKLNGIMMIPGVQTFTPMSIMLTAGWTPNLVRVAAYNNGELVGRLTWKLTTEPRTFYFPAAWRVTQLIFTPDFVGKTAVYPAGSMVIHNFTIMMH